VQEEHIRTKEAELAEFRRYGERLQAQLNAFYTSTSWRISWPVRAVARLLGRG